MFLPSKLSGPHDPTPIPTSSVLSLPSLDGKMVLTGPFTFLHQVGWLMLIEIKLEHVL